VFEKDTSKSAGPPSAAHIKLVLNLSFGLKLMCSKLRGNDMVRTNIARMVFFARVALIGAALCLAVIAVPAAADDSPPSSATAVGIFAENAVIETDTAVYTIKKIELLGSSLTNADLAALLDPKADMTLPSRFAKLSASAVFIPEFKVTTKSEPIQTVVYQNIKLTDVKNGKAAEADIETSLFFVAHDGGDRIEGTYGHIHAQGIDLALASRIMSETRGDEIEPLKPLYQNFLIEGFKLNVIGRTFFSMTIGKLYGRDVMARAFAIRPSDYQTATGDQTQLAALMRDYFSSIQMEELVANDIEIVSKSDDKPVRMSLGKMSVSKFGSAKIEDVDFGSFAMKVEDTSIKVEDIDLKNIDFQKLHEPLTNGTLKGGDVHDSKDGSAATDDATHPQPAILIPTVAQFIMTKIDVSFRDEERESAIAKPSFAIDHFEVDGAGAMPLESTPTHMTASLDHFTFNPIFLKDSYLRPLIDMGYSKLDLSSRIEMAWDMSTQELTVKDISLNGSDMGALKVSGVIDNLSEDFFSGDSAAMQAAAFGASIKKIDIRLDNAGLFERVVALQAKEQHTSVETVKQSYVANAAIGIPAMLNNKPAAKMIGAAVAKFAANPKSLHIVASSADGLGAADFALMKDVTTLLDSLDIKATAND